MADSLILPFYRYRRRGSCRNEILPPSHRKLKWVRELWVWKSLCKKVNVVSKSEPRYWSGWLISVINSNKCTKLDRPTLSQAGGNCIFVRHKKSVYFASTREALEWSLGNCIANNHLEFVGKTFRSGVLLSRVWMHCDFMIQQGISPVESLSGIRLTTPSELQGMLPST